MPVTLSITYHMYIYIYMNFLIDSNRIALKNIFLPGYN